MKIYDDEEQKRKDEEDRRLIEEYQRKKEEMDRAEELKEAELVKLTKYSHNEVTKILYEKFT